MAAHLPDEILLLIQDHLSWPRQPNLLLVSRRFYRLFLPRIYGFIHCGTLGGRQKVIDLIRAALRNPDIARAIHGLALPGLYPGRDTIPVDEVDIPNVRHLIQRASHDPAEATAWEEDLRHGSLDAWVSLLLTQTANIAYLDFDTLDEPPYLRRMLARNRQAEKPFDTFPALQRLQDLSIGNRDSNYPYRPDEALPFLSLPSLRSFTATRAAETYGFYEEEDAEDHVEKPVKGTSGVTSLRFTNSNGKFGMRKVVAACANLESFEYQHRDLFAQGDFLEHFVPGAFLAPLLMQKDSLAKFRFNDRCHDPPFQIGSEYSRRNEKFGSLAEFTALKDVHIRLPNLVGEWWDQGDLVDLLPPSLETLYLAHCWNRHLDRLILHLEQMIEARGDRFGHLRELQVQPYFLDIISKEEFTSLTASREPPAMTCEDFRKFDRLRGMCDVAGITFSIDRPQFMATMSLALPWYAETENR